MLFRSVQSIEKVLGNRAVAGRIFHLIDGFIHNLELGEMIVELVDSFGEIEGIRGEPGVAMSNQAAIDLGVEFKGREGIKEYIKLVHKLQTEYGGDRNVQNW